MDNVLEQEWNSYFKQLTEAERISVLSVIKTFLQRGHEDSGRMSLEQYNKEIDEALAAAAAGDYITQEEMEKRAALW